MLGYRRGRHVVGDRLVGKPPFFAPGAGESRFIGYGRSLVVENNAGPDGTAYLGSIPDLPGVRER